MYRMFAPIGDLYTGSIPNITGYIGGTTPEQGLVTNMAKYNTQQYAPWSGCFSADSGYFNAGSYTGGGSAFSYGQINGQRFIFDASRSNAIYGKNYNDYAVFPRSLNMFHIIKY